MKVEKEYWWVAGVDSIYLGEPNGVLSMVSNLSKAKKFHSKDSALHFIYGDRKANGDSFVQLVCLDGVGPKTHQKTRAHMARFLKLELTSILENSNLMSEKRLHFNNNEIS